MRDAVWAGAILTRLSSRTSPPPGAMPTCAGAPSEVAAADEDRET